MLIDTIITHCLLSYGYKHDKCIIYRMKIKFADKYMEVLCENNYIKLLNWYRILRFFFFFFFLITDFITENNLKYDTGY